jgi:hypothetical protein
MAGKRVAVVDPEGKFATVDESDVENLPEGARVLTKQQLAEKAVEDRYEALPTGRKVLGALGTAASAINPLTFGSNPDAPPTAAAYGEGVREGLTGGLSQAGTRKLADAVGGKAAGDAHAQQIDEQETASPWAKGAGNVAGFLGGTALGAAGGAPGAIGALGGLAEQGTERALASVAARGVLGRAATTAAGMGVRGALEGAAYGGLGEVSQGLLHDTPITGEKLYAALGHGALMGGALGTTLGFGGSLAASGARGILGKLVGGSNAIAGATEEGVSALRKGAREAQGNAEDALGSLGRQADDRQYLRHTGKVREFTPEGIAGHTAEFGEIPDRRLQIVPMGDIEHQEVWDPTKLAALRKTYAEGKSLDPIRLGLGPEGKWVIEDGIHRTALAKELGMTHMAAETTQSIPKGEIGRFYPPVGGGPAETMVGALKDLTGAAKKPSALVDAAHDQAFRAAGGGMGLQSTRFAKQAAKYFGGPEGTKNLGEMALRYGIVDAGEAAASPWKAGWSAFKNGRPADMLPKAAAVDDMLGKKIGELTQASGARVNVGDISDAFGRVRAEPAGLAGNEHVVSAIDDYHRSLLNHLPISRDGTVSVQDLLKQRKGLDHIVYQETKTLDPGRRVAALRAVRGEMEELVTKALDDASGKMPGELRSEYEALKKDFHGVRILHETIEDSAARMSKHATLGLGEKLALGASLAAGHFASGPILAVGGKVIKERGNAAAAAFLKRAADQGSFTKLLGDFDAKVSKAATGALKDGPSKSTVRVPKRATAGGGTPDDADAGRAQVAASQAKAADIIKTVGDMRANPQRLQGQLDEASAIVGRAAGPSAAQSYSGATIKAVNFISSYIPVKERRDPLDPRSVPPLTYDEADRLVRAATYATKPETVWDDFEKGKVTPEGLSAAKTFMPDSFAQFQQELMDRVQDHMLSNKRLSDAQRLRVDKLLGYPAGPALKPAAIARLQSNLSQAPQGPAKPPQTGGPVNLDTKNTGFDSVEARMSH